jgi:hypothetical protein
MPADTPDIRPGASPVLQQNVMYGFPAGLEAAWKLPGSCRSIYSRDPIVEVTGNGDERPDQDIRRDESGDLKASICWIG